MSLTVLIRVCSANRSCRRSRRARYNEGVGAHAEGARCCHEVGEVESLKILKF